MYINTEKYFQMKISSLSILQNLNLCLLQTKNIYKIPEQLISHDIISSLKYLGGRIDKSLIKNLIKT